MCNELIHTTKCEYIESDPTSKLGNCFIVNLKGNEISNKMELFSVLQKEYTLPDANSWEGITDWLTDLSWIETDNSQLIVHNYTDFLGDDNNLKDIFEEILIDFVLPFLEKEILTTVVKGEPKGFIVYLID